MYDRARERAKVVKKHESCVKACSFSKSITSF
jgi:hypothetical protein